MKTKSDFVRALLAEKNLRSQEREKIIELGFKELSEERNQAILKVLDEARIVFKNDNEDIKTKLDFLIDNYSAKLQDVSGSSIIEKSSTYPISHNLKTTVKLLSFFTDNQKSLKYTTHSWEEGRFRNYEDFMSKIREEWEEIKEELKIQNIRLYSKISSFLFNPNLGKVDSDGKTQTWGEKRLKFGWSSPGLKEFLLNEKDDPFTFKIPEEIKSQENIELNYFSGYIEEFKNEIEFREDSQNLQQIFLEIWENEIGYDFNVIGIENLDGISYFADVENFKKVIKKIFRNSIGRRLGFNEVLINCSSNFVNDNFHIIRITQKDSHSPRNIEDPKITMPSGDLFDIINSLKNISDYSIESKFQDEKYYRVNYLSSSNQSFIEEINENLPLGFTHIFKFYM
jgi:hypothetical protein